MTNRTFLTSLVSLSVLAMCVTTSCCCAEESANNVGYVNGVLLIAQDADGASSSSTATSTDSDDSSSSTTTTTETSPENRTENLANLEALMNIIGSLCLITGLLTAFSLFVSGTIIMVKRQRKKWIGGLLIGWSLAAVIGAVMAPGITSWLMASAKDANLFE